MSLQDYFESVRPEIMAEARDKAKLKERQRFDAKRAEFMHFLTQKVNEHCSCGGKPYEDKDACGPCKILYRAFELTKVFEA